ncbi:MAG TPA: HAD domain-containing protein [Solirubrobacteraceae bacterium]
MRDKPLLFVDIDGVISLWGWESNVCPAGAFHDVDGIMHFLSGVAGNHLLALMPSFDLVWCSGWEEKANDHLPRSLGLPGELPFLSFDRNPGRGHGHWKLASIEAYAGSERPLAWIDDAHDDASRAWAARRDAPTLLVETVPASGLVQTHVARLQAWAGELPARRVWTPQARRR